MRTYSVADPLRRQTLTLAALLMGAVGIVAAIVAAIIGRRHA